MNSLIKINAAYILLEADDQMLTLHCQVDNHLILHTHAEVTNQLHYE